MGDPRDRAAKQYCTADLHEHLVEIPPCDLLLIAGDVSYAFKGDLVAEQAFLAGEFEDWLDRVPADEVVLVAGNHDQSIEKWGVPDGLRCHYLRDAEIELFGLRIWGTPWQPWFYDWAFNAPRRDGEAFLATKFDAIPSGVDIVVAHGPPHGYGDVTRADEHVGSTAMTSTLERVRPRLMVCGHIHPAYGRYRSARRRSSTPRWSTRTTSPSTADGSRRGQEPDRRRPRGDRRAHHGSAPASGATTSSTPSCQPA